MRPRPVRERKDTMPRTLYAYVSHCKSMLQEFDAVHCVGSFHEVWRMYRTYNNRYEAIAERFDPIGDSLALYTSRLPYSATNVTRYMRVATTEDIAQAYSVFDHTSGLLIDNHNRNRGY